MKGLGSSDPAADLHCPDPSTCHGTPENLLMTPGLLHRLELKIAFLTMAFDCSNTDGPGMMCSFLARAVTNNQGVGNVEYSNVSAFTMFVDCLVYYIDMARKGLKISYSSTWCDLHNTDRSDMTCSSQGVGDSCDFRVYLNGLVYYIDRICTDGRGMMSSVRPGPSARTVVFVMLRKSSSPTLSCSWLAGCTSTRPAMR